MATTTKTSDLESRTQKVPILRNGDHLDADEFLRRYDAMPNLKKAELIEGVVYIPSADDFDGVFEDGSMGSPVSIDNHSAPHFDLIGWLAFYRSATPGVRGSDNGTVRLDLKNVPQPDAFLFIKAENGGQSRVGEDGYLQGAPELVVEISDSTVGKDLNEKLETYRRNHAPEYIVWRVQDRAIDWMILQDGVYQRLEVGPDGIYKSRVFPGLWLDPEALIRGDLATVFEVVQRGLADPGHIGFIEQLRRAGEGL